MTDAPRRFRGRTLSAEPINGAESTEALLHRAFLAYGGREIRRPTTC